ncbi:MAG: translation initiation factor IF-2, partial [Clostridiaceae bacterium]|nr:translation initiation factor IF-2 [Clostridiaceae bacterium]
VITRIYNIIYELVDEVDDVLSGMIEIEKEETITGKLEVRQVFVLSDNNIVSGCMVREGICSRGQKCYVERGGERIFEGKVSSLRVLKDEVNKVKKGQECGIIIAPKFEIETGDSIICYRIEK